MSFDWRKLFSFYQRLSPRERTLVGLAAGAVVVAALYAGIWKPLQEGRVLMERRIAAKEKELEEIVKMRATYFELARQIEAARGVLCQPKEDFSLFPFIEATVGQVVGREKILSMNPSSRTISNNYKEESVEVKLSGIPLDQLVDLMYRIEVADGPCPLRVTRLTAKKKAPKDPHSFDVTATVSMLQEVTQG